MRSIYHILILTQNIPILLKGIHLSTNSLEVVSSIEISVFK
jgi:hypothetical protein